MQQIRKFPVWIVGLLAIFALAACESDDGSSAGLPMGPTSVPITSSATINGTITSTTASLAAPVSAPVRTVAPTAGMTVSVSGTSRSAVANSEGRFSLTNVSPGPVRLRFTGAGVNDVLEFRSVGAGEIVNIVVAVTGSTVVLQSEGPPPSADPSDDDDPNDPTDDDEDADDDSEDDDDSDEAGDDEDDEGDRDDDEDDEADRDEDDEEDDD
jgi:hypothetical protein